ncbi:hypothetical protein ACK3YP_12865 [Aeromonas allosaccharophila]|uniref:hypothetical protein n=1 Tax=Aeromonas allosaccharophila TaxID=656 RepID=UPI0039879370
MFSEDALGKIIQKQLKKSKPRQVNDGNCGARHPDNQQRPNNYTSNYLLGAMRTTWGTRKGAEESQSRG